jgi:ATPase family AAA domain-containing protein 1
MPRAFEVPLPNSVGRLAILQLLFKDENVDITVVPALPKLVDATQGYSGSDLKELCKAAAMVAIQEHTAEFARRRVMGENDASLDDALSQRIRPITETDLVVGLKKVRRTGEAAFKYGKAFEQEQRQQQGNDGAGLDLKSLQNLANLFRSLSSHIPDDESNDNGIPNL